MDDSSTYSREWRRSTGLWYEFENPQPALIPALLGKVNAHQRELLRKAIERRESNIVKRGRKKRILHERARSTLNRAVYNGEFPRVTTQLCRDCGRPAQHYHHLSYDDPFDVLPVCQECHSAIHGYPVNTPPKP